LLKIELTKITGESFSSDSPSKARTPKSTRKEKTEANQDYDDYYDEEFFNDGDDHVCSPKKEEKDNEPETETIENIKNCKDLLPAKGNEGSNKPTPSKQLTSAAPEDDDYDDEFDNEEEDSLQKVSAVKASAQPLMSSTTQRTPEKTFPVSAVISQTNQEDQIPARPVLTNQSTPTSITDVHQSVDLSSANKGEPSPVRSADKEKAVSSLDNTKSTGEDDYDDYNEEFEDFDD
jgi:hypothetical protein